jgi:sulfite reductase (NADPH) hemoprotein beta-component
LAKSYGIYLEFNRAKSGAEKDWMYMVRVSNPGGGPISREQWRLFDGLAEQWGRDPEGRPSLRLTTRQNIQFHWVKKPGVIPLVKALAEAGIKSLNGCGDNTRNVMACPLSRFGGIFDAHAWARKTADYFELPAGPYLSIFAIDPAHLRVPGETYAYGPGLLNRKFKIAFSALHADERGVPVPDNCAEILTNDLAAAPVISGGRVTACQLYVGGGQGERNGYFSTAALAQPLGIVGLERLLPALEAVVKTQDDWGDRKNRVWARMKYLVREKGVAWFRKEAEARLGFRLEDPDPALDYGCRELHHGWCRLPSGLWAFGAYIENGRLSDTPENGRLKAMVRHLMETYPVELLVTPNQDLVFTGIPAEARADFEKDLARFGQGQRNGKPVSVLRRRSGSCVGRDTCRLAYTDSEKFEPELLDELEKRGWGGTAESIGVTGCERQCFRPATKTIGLVGTGLNLYQLKLFGDDSGKHQGRPLTSSDGRRLYLRAIPRDKAADVIETLLTFHRDQARPGEGLGDFHRRLGPDAIIAHLQSHPATALLADKPVLLE